MHDAASQTGTGSAVTCLKLLHAATGHQIMVDLVADRCGRAKFKPRCESNELASAQRSAADTR